MPRPPQFTLRHLFTAMLLLSAALGLANQVGFALALTLAFLGWLMLLVCGALVGRLFDFHAEQVARELRREVQEFARQNRNPPA